MGLDKLLSSDEKKLIKRQHIASYSTIILFLIVSIFTSTVFYTIYIPGFIICALLFYLGISSYLYEVSIMNIRGKKEYAKGTHAKRIGIILFIAGIISTLINIVLNIII